MADLLLDVKGLDCPLPLMKVKAILDGAAVGQRVEVLTTDPGAVADFQAFCRVCGHTLLSHEEEGEVYRLHIVRG